jgi:hypothetical protein
MSENYNLVVPNPLLKREGGIKDYFFVEEWAITILLSENVLMCNEGKADDGETTLCLYVNCSDLFALASADAECITMKELEDLWLLKEKGYKNYAILWVINKRKMKPVQPVIDMLKDEGEWIFDENLLI